MTALEFNTTRRYVLGLGCERGTSPDEVMALVFSALEMAGIVPAQVAGLASIDSRRGEPAMAVVAARLAIPMLFFDAATLEKETPRIKNPSDVVFARVGCHGVAESAALAAIGPDAELALAKIKSAHATAAIARALLRKE
ncbi:cobalamin biosynthesis protein [Rhizobium metallidurans]|uniref:Cobalt-precorrin 5A hydrolase/precorrin-3B C17-methyltransferase n=1 Tax=Rhizobium metallidurans TaxID=1265931 RepID=A0A7W6CQQ5_9HYPH|nr:cobalamin biosynthesis protein [Rhizobium metallidurans]MBB3963247.1 cobalt-precorrin 5A hydrolase/precorrin-3B C17-methyltransferase [Rhizobium metallidurans]